MRKWFFGGFILLFVFFLSFQTHAEVATSEACISFTGLKDWYIKVGSDKPNWLEGVEARNTCFNEKLILGVDDQLVDMNVIDGYKIYYYAMNLSGDVYKMEPKMVYVREDINPPVINNTQDITIMVFDSVDANALLEHVTASDLKDGDLTSNIKVDYSQVDPNKLGDYNVIYSVKDLNENETKVTVKLHVVDKTNPVITLIQSELDLEVFGTICDFTPYFSVSDNYDSNPSVFVDDSLVKEDVLGDYPVKITVTDGSSNESQAEIIVHVIDKTPPVIDLENQKLAVLSDEPDWLTFIEVSDNYDETPEIVVDASLVHLDLLGEYPVIYTVKDQSGNDIQKTMIVTIVDEVSPVISNVHDIYYRIGDDEPDYLNGLTISDNYDKTLTVDSIIVSFNYVDLKKPGIYPLHYFVGDSSGNMTTAIADVHVSSKDLPTIEGMKDIKISTIPDSLDLLDGVSAKDKIDGNITSKIVIYHVIDFHTEGVYPVDYFVWNSGGVMVTKRIYVTIEKDVTAPVVLPTMDIKINVHDVNFDFKKAILVEDNFNEVEITVDASQVDFNSLGDYEVIYTISDPSSNVTTLTKTVHVEDLSDPVLKGVKDYSLRMNSHFDPLKGITASDNYDGDLTSLIKASGYYDLKKPGTYYITIKVQDSSGNETSDIYQLVIRDNKPNYINGLPIVLIGLSIFSISVISIIWVKKRQD